MNHSQDNKRIAKNTIMLYFRMAIILLVNLYTSRVILASLGVDDYGIYTAVGGFVGLFGIISSSLSNAVSRFLNYSMGKENFTEMKRVFSSAIVIHLILATIVIILLETIGVWFLNNQMEITQGRLRAANYVFQLSVAAFACSLLNTPFNATIIAHEHMSFYAIMSIIEAALKLGIAFLISISTIDKLIFFASLQTLLAGLVVLCTAVYCFRHFRECNLRLYFDSSITKKMFGFAGWNFIGSSAAILRIQGNNILINLFFGPAVNAAMGLATQVNTAVNGFVGNFMTAINPQITKSYASGDHKYMMSLTYVGARLSFYLLLFLSLPVLLNTKYILSLWLTVVPEHTVTFIQLLVIYSLFDATTRTLIMVMLATGNIRNYQLVVGGLSALCIPISYVCLKLGAIPETVLLVSIIIWHACLLARLLMLKKMITLSIGEFVRKVYLNSILIFIASAVIPLIISWLLPYGTINFIIVSLSSMISVCVVVYFVGTTKFEKKTIKGFISSKIGSR